MVKLNAPLERSNLSSYVPSANLMVCMEPLRCGHDSVPYVPHKAPYPHKRIIRLPYAPIRFTIRFLEAHLTLI
jgi:hypothetical protein